MRAASRTQGGATRSRRRTCSVAIAASLAVVVLVLGGCGDGTPNSKRLARTTAAKLRTTLNDVEQMASEGNCDGARAQTAALQQQVSSLPNRVDSKLREALVAGSNRLLSLVDNDCRPATTTQPTTQPQPPPAEEPPAQKKKEKAKTKPPGLKKGNEQDDQNTGGTTTPDTDTTTDTTPTTETDSGDSSGGQQAPPAAP